MKARAKSLLYFLRKNDVNLSGNGEINYDKVNKKIHHVIKKQEQLVKLVLMQ